MGIFETTAPKYWEKGLSAIPLKVNDKVPDGLWRDYIDQDSIPENVRILWAHSKANGNIGLIMGQPSGICCIDVDTLDVEVQKAIENVLPRSPWVRVGKKGWMAAYKWNPKLGSHPIKDKNGGMIVEIKSRGTQIVLPPSIHPETLKPYYANCELYNVIDQLQELPDNLIDQIRAAIAPFVELAEKTSNKFNSLEHVPTGARDNKMTNAAGHLSHEIFRGEITLKRAIQKMLSWVDNMVATNNGDNLSESKAVGKLIEFMMKDLARGKLLPNGWDEDLSDEEKKQLGLDVQESQEEWTINQYKSYITTQYFEVDPADEHKRYSIMTTVLSKVATSVSLTELEISLILKYIKELSLLKLTEATMRKYIRDLKKGPISGESHTEVATTVIERFEERSGKLALNGAILSFWNGSHWEEVKEQELRKLIQSEFGELSSSKKFSDHKQIVQVIRDQVPQYLTANPVDGVNFDNGFLTKDLRLMPHQPEYGATYTLPYRYDPYSVDSCVMFKKYLHDSWGHHEDYEDKMTALKEAICVTFFGIATSFQRAILLYSHDGQTGKSVLLDIISGLVPPETRCAISPDQWGEKYVPTSFYGRLLNQAGELSATAWIDGKSFKEIIDGSPITTAFKYKDHFTFRPKTAHWFCSNHLPKTKDTSSGFNRRWLILEYDKVISTEDMVRDLGAMIVDQEMESIVAWAVEAMPDLIKRQNFTVPKSHYKYLLDMEMQNSTIKQFINYCITAKKGTKIVENEIYKDYYTYVIGVLHDRPIVKQKFTIQLQAALSERKMLNCVTVGAINHYHDIKVELPGK